MRKPGVLLFLASLAFALGACSSTRRIASVESGATLRQWLELPSLLDSDLGNSRVFVASTLSRKISVDRVAPSANPRDRIYAAHPPGSFVVKRPKGASDAEVREALAGEVLNALLDRLYPVSSRREALFRMPQDGLRDRPLIERIRAYGRPALLGDSTPRDPAVERWWKLRLREDVKAARPQEGSTVLVTVRAYGYRARKYVSIDAGHSAMAVITLNDDPNDDILINPGAKSREGHEVELPFGPKRGVLNEVHTANFWDWAETQIIPRHLNLQMKILAVDPLQGEALQLIAQEGHGMEFGAARLVGNNCANGARDILNSILPLNRELPFQLSPIALPREILNGAANSFPELGELEMLGTPVPAGELETPALGVQELSPEERRASKSFGIYLDWLSKYLR